MSTKSILSVSLIQNDFRFNKQFFLNDELTGDVVAGSIIKYFAGFSHNAKRYGVKNLFKCSEPFKLSIQIDEELVWNSVSLSTQLQSKIKLHTRNKKGYTSFANKLAFISDVMIEGDGIDYTTTIENGLASLELMEANLTEATQLINA